MMLDFIDLHGKFCTNLIIVLRRGPNLGLQTRVVVYKVQSNIRLHTWEFLDHLENYKKYCTIVDRTRNA